MVKRYREFLLFYKATLLVPVVKKDAKKIENGMEETLPYCDFPSEHWIRIYINNVIERINWEIHRRTRVVGALY